MAKVDRDLQEIIRFCRDFDSTYLSELRANAGRLKTIASSAEASLGGTKFATNASQSLQRIAEQLMKAAASGEVRVREIEKRAKAQEEERVQIEKMCENLEL